MASNVTK